MTTPEVQIVPGSGAGPGAGRSASDGRQLVREARRVVVKIGSSSLTRPGDGLDMLRLQTFIDALVGQIGRGKQVVVVTSGSITAGLAPLGLAQRPKDLAGLQAAASVGQGLLVAAYTEAFATHRLRVGQVLLTVDDVTRRTHYRNVHRTIETLLACGVVPIVNENDTVATDEIRFGDNDRLAALVAHLAKADALVLLSDVDGVFTGPPGTPGARLISDIRSKNDLEGVQLGGSTNGIGTGGMFTKIQSARIAAAAGIPTVLANSGRAADALAGREVGTLFHPWGSIGSLRLLWLFASVPTGRVVIDDGAVEAIVTRHTSLLAAGVTGAAGSFVAGDAVDVCDARGQIVARGLVNYDSTELPAMMGHSTNELVGALGADYAREVIHRDDMVRWRRQN